MVAVEEPGDSRARALLASHGATVVGVPVDPEGIVVQRIPAGARLVFSTPSHQFPLGFVMSLARRRELLRWADDAAIFEDDYDSEFRFTPRPLAPLHSLDREGRVLYAGTFSKSLLPSLRIGFLVAPPSLRSALRAARQLTRLARGDGATGHSCPVHRRRLTGRTCAEGRSGVPAAAHPHARRDRGTSR